jgi:hypothetical protein
MSGMSGCDRAAEGQAVASPHGLGRADPQLGCDRLHRGSLGWVVGADLRNHAHRTLTKLRRVWGRTCHDSILSRNRASIRPGALHAGGREEAMRFLGGPEAGG